MPQVTDIDSTAASPASKPVRRRPVIRRVLLALLLIALGYVAWDLFLPHHSSLRNFDPDEVARLETAMWRSYYSRERLKLFNELAELMRSQYKLPVVRSNAVAYQAARAAFVFKDGHSRKDYEKALPYLQNFYSSIRRVSDIPFDVDRAARLEVEWWIIHRERAQHQPGDLTTALADLAAEIYQVPPEQLMEHARLRADAMTIRDDKAEQGGVTEQDWAQIDQLLHQSWRSLHDAVNRVR